MKESLEYQLCKLLTIFACVLVLMIGVYSCHQNYLIKEAISKGADPIKVKCAIEGIDNQSVSICTIAAQI